MAFDKTLPSDSTKIRNYPRDLTNNFAGIQEGDATFKMQAVNYLDRTVEGLVPITPARIDDTMIIYSRDDGTNTELFILNDQAPADDLQLTQVDALGSTSTPVKSSALWCTSLSFDEGDSSMNKIHQVTGWAKVSSAGLITSGSGNLTATKTGSGLYRIGFSVAPATATFVGMATIDDTSSHVIRINTYTATTFFVKTYVLSVVGGALNEKAKSSAFQVVVFGGR